MKMKKITALVMAGAMCLGLMAGCGGNKAPAANNSPAPAPVESNEPAAPAESQAPVESTGAAGTFKLGCIGPFTGGAAIYGLAVKNGAEIAVEEINALGGIQFELKSEDDTHDAEISVNAYNTLMDWGMQALVGTVTTAPCIAVSAETNADRVFEITPSASSTDVINGKDNVFQVCFTDPNQGVASADYISENFAGAKVAVIYRNDDAYSQGIRDTFASQSAVKGVDVVYEGTFTEATQTDFSVQLNAAQAAGADMVFLPIYYQPASVILAQANQMGYAPTFFGVDGMDGILTLEGFDTTLAEGVMLLTPFSADAPDEMTQSFVAKYVAKTGEIPNQFAADAYDVVYTIYAALQAAGCTADMSPEEICEACVAVMPTLSVDGLTGSGMTWAPTGEVSKAPMAVVIENGAYVLP